MTTATLEMAVMVPWDSKKERNIVQWHKKYTEDNMQRKVKACWKFFEFWDYQIVLISVSSNLKNKLFILEIF